jgi:hypothetical protein
VKIFVLNHITKRRANKKGLTRTKHTFWKKICGIVGKHFLLPFKQMFVTTITFLTAGERDSFQNSFNAKMRRKLFGTDRAVQHQQI